MVLLIGLIFNTSYAKEFTIPLNQSSMIEPLIEWVGPPPESVDGKTTVFSLSNEGAEIHQRSGSQTATNTLTGFKMLLPSGGDFEWELDCECRELEAPKEGWGQGLIMKAYFNDMKRTDLTFGWCCEPNNKPMFMVGRESKTSNDPYFNWIGAPFKSGKLLIVRKGSNVTMMVKSENNQQVIATIPITTSDIRSFEVWSTRQATGNGAAHFLLRKTKLKADTHPGLESPYRGWSWWTIFTYAQYAFATLVLLWYVKSRMKNG